MNESRIEGALTQLEGKAQNGVGRLLGDGKMQIEGHLKDAKGKALDAYGQAIDGLERLADRAPAELRGRAHQGLDFARRKPVVTTAIVAGLGLLLAGLSRRGR